AGSLFDLENDLGETEELSDQHPAVSDDLRRAMTAFTSDFETTRRPSGEVDAFAAAGPEEP
ncbi:MAG: hypothetical protein AAF596_05390, partial [Planctomycetota bacterium]